MMKVHWKKFGWVEAQVWEPETPASSAILFCPGFPGMGGTVFEQRHAAALAEEGYAVYVIKHKGTILSGAMAPVMVNNAARLMQGRKKNEKYLGGASATIEDWLEEPLHVLKAIDAVHEDIHVIGNSFGALSSLWSLTEQGAPLSKVRGLILYAGAQGTHDETEDSIMRIWLPEFMMASRITEKVALNDPFDMAATMKKTYGVLPERVSERLADHIALTYLVVDRDEFLRRGDTERFQGAIGGRGKIVIDDYDHAWLDHGLLAHDTPNYKTEDLLALIRG